MSDFVQAALALAPEDPAACLRELGKNGRKIWQGQTMPNRKTENWKYTSLRVLEEGDYLRRSEGGAVTDVQAIERLIASDSLTATPIVFINGQYSEALSAQSMPAGVSCVQFSHADSAQQTVIGAALGRIADAARHPFVALNDSTCEDGLLIDVAPDTRLKNSLQICNIVLPQAQSYTVQQRVLLNIGSGADASVIERYVSNTSKQNCFINSVTEVALADNARLSHYYLDMAGEDALHIGGVYVDLGRDATYNGFQLGHGGNLQRLDLQVNHNVSGSHCELNGIYLPNKAQLVDFHTCVEHRAPHCTTNEVYRGIVGDAAKAVFNGRIHIHPDAQKTVADLSNKNLLTSYNAEVDTKPELEIYADDVKCSHGATVAQLDEKSLYYLRSRGIDHDAAVMMLSYGFISEVLDSITDAGLRGLLQPLLSQAISEEFHLQVATS